MNSKGKPILISTGSLDNENGMATYEEIIQALEWLDGYNTKTLLHCVSKYPCDEPHYERISEISSHCMNVGLSDHSKTIKVPKGLSVYEKHFMLEDSDCIDKNVSLTPSEFKEMVKWLRSL